VKNSAPCICIDLPRIPPRSISGAGRAPGQFSLARRDRPHKTLDDAELGPQSMESLDRSFKEGGLCLGPLFEVCLVENFILLWKLEASPSQTKTVSPL
jgi:hypothetical protein